MKSNSRKRASETTIIKSESTESHYDLHPSSTFGSTNTNSNNGTSRPKLRVRIKRWHGVAHWTWNCGDGDEVCGICQCAYEGVPPDVKYPGDECPVVWGTCKHSFHIQCIEKWLPTRGTCPMCRSEWEIGAEKSVHEDNA